MYLPIEIIDQIISHTTFEQAINISNYAAKKLYNPRKHNVFWAVENNNLAALKWLHKFIIDSEKSINCYIDIVSK